MTGEPREDMDVPPTDRLPPAVASRAFTARSDSALSGAPLPPYRPGMYAGLQASPAISDLSAALKSEHEVGPPVAEGWPAEWRDDPVPPEEPLATAEEHAAAPPSEGPDMLFLDETEIAPIEDRDPTGFEQAAGHLETEDWPAEPFAQPAEAWNFEPEPEPEPSAEPAEAWNFEPEPEPEPSAEPAEAWHFEPEPEPQRSYDSDAGWQDQPEPPEQPEQQAVETASWEPAAPPDGPESGPRDVAPELDVPAGEWAEWDSEETAVYDLPTAAGEDTGPWQRSWETALPGAEEPAEVDYESAAEAPFAATGELDVDEPPLDDGPESAGDVQEWLETGAVDIDALDPDSPLDAEAEPIGIYDSGEWPAAEPGEETGELVEMVEDEAESGATLEFAPASDDSDEAPADEAWAPFEPRGTPPGQPAAAAVDASPADTGEAGPDEPADERVAIVPPTPLDTWYHGEHGVEAEATWAAFGRALEEAASWGDLGATIATGLPPDQARSEPSGEAPEHEPAAQQPAEHAAEATAQDPAVVDLARRLEQLAQRLRTEGEKGMEHALSEGDRLEASLAGFIAGYVAARRG